LKKNNKINIINPNVESKTGEDEKVTEIFISNNTNNIELLQTKTEAEHE